MLLSKTAVVKWNSANKKNYEEKGYVYTKMKDEFEVKVEDLSVGSHSLVNVMCDCESCKNPYLNPMTWGNYIKWKQNDGNYYCNKCLNKISTSEKTRQTKLRNGKSLYDWCIRNNRQDLLDRWCYKLNKCSPKDILYSTHKKYWFKCPRGLHPSELKNMNNITSGADENAVCNMCNSFAQVNIDLYGEDFLDKYWDWEKNSVLGIDPWIISYGNNRVKVWLFCQEKDYHGSYDIMCNEFNAGNRCGYCKGIRVHYIDSLGYLYPEVIPIWSEKNEKSPYEYAPWSQEKVLWKCLDGHKNYKKRIRDAHKANFRCPDCVKHKKESILQEKVRLYLNDLGYITLHEYRCNICVRNPKNNYQLPYDNEVVELKLIIEVMGKQHYELSTWHKHIAKHKGTTPENELHMQKVRDRYKRIKARQNNYEYLAIPYWTDNKNEDWKQLIDSKLVDIKNKNRKDG